MQMLPIDGICPFREHPFRLYDGERLADMAGSITEEHVLEKLGSRKEKLDASYFNIILTGDYDVTIQSKNVGHFWYLHNTEYPAESSCIIFHKHKASHPYHRYGKSRNLRQAIRSIKGHDVFQMNGRKCI